MSQFFNQFQAVPFKTTEHHPVELFFQKEGRYSNFQKETFFLRLIVDTDFALWSEQCKSWQKKHSGHLYVAQFSSQLDPSQATHYRDLYNQKGLQPSFQFQNIIWNETFHHSLQNILQLFQKIRNCKEESILCNFAVKLFYWIDLYFPQLFIETTKMNQFPKFICSGKIGTSEYLFLYLLYQLGCDVLYLGQGQDVSVSSTELLSLSQRVEQPPVLQQTGEQFNPISPIPAQQRPTISRSSLQRADRVNQQPVHTQPTAPQQERNILSRASLQHPNRTPSAKPQPSPPTPTAQKQPMEFEQLAGFASSVVMLKIFDENNECVKTGSGIIISNQGYILTNFHVVCGGSYYGILLEEETDVFYTDTLVKYHPEWDLAILRFDKYRTPIPILDASERLVRGQKVVAIGSPLGLFNTISDGIVSGFRDLRGMSMVQFTAPVSHGSSGGALLDMYGRLIGVITAGFDDGQNLNLAVNHNTILQFVGNLL